jgi:energy-coupling factor transporter ATP-binding protein EcfA2
MAVKFTDTGKSATHVKVLVFGPSGVGKTTLIKTLPNPLIITSEKKLLALKDEKIRTIVIDDHHDLERVYTMIMEDPKFKPFETIVLDSVSDIAETLLDHFREHPVDGNPHPQAPYGSMLDVLIPLIKKFRDIPDKHVYFIAKAKYVQDQNTGITMWMPSCPGQKLGPELPYLFDIVLAMRIGERESGKQFRYLQTQPDIQWAAKGVKGLDHIERPNLSYLFDKVLAKTPEKVGMDSEEPTKEEIQAQREKDATAAAEAEEEAKLKKETKRKAAAKKKAKEEVKIEKEDKEEEAPFGCPDNWED